MMLSKQVFPVTAASQPADIIFAQANMYLPQVGNLPAENEPYIPKEVRNLPKENPVQEKTNFKTGKLWLDPDRGILWHEIGVVGSYPSSTARFNPIP